MLPDDLMPDCCPPESAEGLALVVASTGARAGTDVSPSDARPTAGTRDGAEHLCRLVEAVRRFGTIEDLSRTLAGIVLQLQFDSFMFLLTRYPRRGASCDAAPLLLSSYPARWAERYLGERRYLNDPALAKGELRRSPYAWVRAASTSAGEGAPQPRRAAGAVPAGHERGEEGGEHGLTVPIHGPRGELAFFAVGSKGAEQEPVSSRGSELLLQLVAFHAYAAVVERVAQNASGDSFGLTEHEKQCLHWTALGKTTWETAAILERSTATVNFHLRKACRKLGAANKCEAAAKAAYHGVLSL
jgi:LuxR family transcriptional regulator, quorum-sensing system regulator BjaR1